jgi:hypothetical protein
VIDLFVADDSNSKVQQQKVASIFIAPEKQQEELLIEKEWLIAREKRAEREALLKQKKTNEVVVQTPQPNYAALTIDGIDYKLLGIFKRKKNAFILLKAPKNKIIKVIEGQELSPGILLKTVSATQIILTRADEVIEFKLFERNKNA